MRFYESLGAALWAWGGSLRLALDLRFWSPLLMLTLLRLAVLLLLVFFHRPEVAGAGTPLVGLLGGAEALHYPEHLYRMFGLFRPLDAFVTVLAGSVAAGAVSLRFARAYGSKVAHQRWKGLRSGLGQLILLFAIALAAELAFVGLVRLIPEEIRHATTKFRLLSLLLEWGGRIAIQTCLAYAVVEIAVRGLAVREAIVSSVARTRELPLLTLVLVAGTSGLMFPFYLMADIDLGDRIPLPEAVVILVVVQILADLVFTLLRLGALTRVFVWRTEVRR